MEQINSIGIQRLNDWFANYTSLVNNGNICRHNLNGIKNKRYLSLRLSDIDKLDDAIKFLTDNNIDLQGKSIIVELDEEAYLSKEQCAKLIDIRQQLQDSGATVKVKDGALWSLEDIVSANSHIDGSEWTDGVMKFIRTANVVKSLKNLNILQISTRPEPFCSVICNENELIEKFNVHLYPLTLNDVVVRMKKVRDEATAEYLKTLDFINSINENGNTEEMATVASLKAALKELAAEYNCRAIAIQCWTSLQDMAGIMPCFANSMLTDEGIPTVCETDIHGAITTIMAQAATLGEGTPFFADVTVRHPENDNAELLWHCGNFPYSLAKDSASAKIGKSRYHDNNYGISQWELKDGELTIARFDGDHGKYSIFIGEAKTTEGPKNVGSYVWIEVDNWPKWEHKIVEGPYIHHVCGIYGKYGEILLEACKYIDGLEADVVAPGTDELKSRWY